MKWLTLFLLIVFCSKGYAQEGYGNRVRVLALDTVLSYAEIFSSKVSASVPGYRLAFADKETPGTLRHVFKTGGDGTLRFEYKYTRESTGAKQVPIISLQRITGDADAIVSVYNYLFGTGIAPNHLTAMSDEDVMYKGRAYKLIVEPDEYAPGYWSITFLR